MAPVYLLLHKVIHVMCVSVRMDSVIQLTKLVPIVLPIRILSVLILFARAQLAHAKIETNSSYVVELRIRVKETLSVNVQSVNLVFVVTLVTSLITKHVDIQPIPAL